MPLATFACCCMSNLRQTRASVRVARFSFRRLDSHTRTASIKPSPLLHILLSRGWASRCESSAVTRSSTFETMAAGVGPYGTRSGQSRVQLNVAFSFIAARRRTLLGRRTSTLELSTWTWIHLESALLGLFSLIVGTGLPCYMNLSRHGVRSKYVYLVYDNSNHAWERGDRYPTTRVT